ncbi:hypothetical protein D3C85_1601560 [compost metagenome]
MKKLKLFFQYFDFGLQLVQRKLIHHHKTGNFRLQLFELLDGIIDFSQVCFHWDSPSL